MNRILLFLNVCKSFSSRMGIFALHQSSLPKLVVNSQKQKYFESYISKLHWKKNHHADIPDYVYVPNTNLEPWFAFCT